MAGGIGKVSKEQSRQVSLALHPWLPPQQLDFSQFFSFCFCMISFGPKVPGVKSVCKLLT